MNRSISWGIAFIILLFFELLMIQITLRYITFEIDIDFLLTKQDVIANKIWLFSFYSHIFSSIILIPIGAIQFCNYIRLKFAALHKNLGYLYVVIILLISGPSGFYLSIYANGNIIAKSGFIVLSLLWLIFTIYAIYSIFKKDLNNHRTFMIRSYALTLSAITLRILVYIFPKLIMLKGIEVYSIVAWAGWLINLTIAEIYIFYNRNIS
jgi:uncharacterized membrane protein